MGYQAVYLVEYGYREQPYRFVNADRDGNLCFDAWDGTRLRRYYADVMRLSRRLQGSDKNIELLSYEGTPIEVLITDSRILLRVKHFREAFYRDEMRAAVLNSAGAQGGGSYGGRTDGAGQESGRTDGAGQESGRTDGAGPELCPMGMIRYEWISQISYQKKISRSTEECVRIYYRDTSELLWHLDLVFANDSDAEYLANEILHRACRYRLNMTDEKNDKELYFFNRYLTDYEIEPTDDPKHSMSSIRFPTQYPAPGGEDVRPVLR